MSIVVIAAAAYQLVIHTQPSSTATAGQAFATQPVIYEEDRFGNLETADNSTVVTAALESGTGPLQGTRRPRFRRRGDVHEPGRQHGRDDLADVQRSRA